MAQSPDLSRQHSQGLKDRFLPFSLPSQPPDITNWFSSYVYESPESLGLPDPIGSFMLHQEDESEPQEPPECEKNTFMDLPPYDTKNPLVQVAGDDFYSKYRVNHVDKDGFVPVKKVNISRNDDQISSRKLTAYNEEGQDGLSQMQTAEDYSSRRKNNGSTKKEQFARTPYAQPKKKVSLRKLLGEDFVASHSNLILSDSKGCEGVDGSSMKKIDMLPVSNIDKEKIADQQEVQLRGDVNAQDLKEPNSRKEDPVHESESVLPTNYGSTAFRTATTNQEVHEPSSPTLEGKNEPLMEEDGCWIQESETMHCNSNNKVESCRGEDLMLESESSLQVNYGFVASKTATGNQEIHELTLLALQGKNEALVGENKSCVRESDTMYCNADKGENGSPQMEPTCFDINAQVPKATNGFISIKCRGKREGPVDELKSISPSEAATTWKGNNETLAQEDQTHGGSRSALVDRSNEEEIPDEWQCPRKAKADIGPPMKQLRLDRWFRLLNSRSRII
ncbi:uncharacterized protein LOC121994108 isoform X1 [Zingiber officinale]|uniref:uncharacterized protein LOC121994108 isoform X1 n=1 Tax=Zingiber officinale TaxID=94328 RepID=UPI001C4D515A|nr:uncharacterized protein LOC121994108 isoform X1 [Zingiber officinale]